MAVQLTLSSPPSLQFKLILALQSRDFPTSTRLNSSQNAQKMPHTAPARTPIDYLDPPTINGHARIGPIKLHELLNHDQVAGKRAQRIAKAQLEELLCRSWLRAQLGFYGIEPPRGTKSEDMIERLRQCVEDELVCTEAFGLVASADGSTGYPKSCSSSLSGIFKTHRRTFEQLK